MSDTAKPAQPVKLTGRVTQDDPFSGKNALAMKLEGRLPGDDECEAGWQLGWKNEVQRNRSGWEGWEPLEYGDRFTGEKGELLRPYVADAPVRYQRAENIDNLVRRGDLLLCRLRADWFDKRQKQGVDASRHMIEELKMEDGQEILPGVTRIGSGRRVDKNPTFGK